MRRACPEILGRFPDGDMSTQHPFWRSLELGDRATYVGRLGELELHLHRRSQDWWVLRGPWTGQDGEAAAWHAVEELDEAVLEDPERVLRRYLFEQAPREARVSPALADRPVVVRPTSPTSVGPGEEVEVYVGTPVWIVVEVEGATLARLPAERPPDTWFGSSPRHGVLCYAAKSRARLSLDNLTPKEDRVVTRIQIRNRTSEPLELDRWSLPVGYLSIYQGAAGWLWTESVTLSQEESGGLARLAVGSGAPAQAISSEPLAAAAERAPSDPRFLAFGARAIGALLRAP